MNIDSTNKKTLLGVILIILTVMVYFNSLSVPFQYDDYHHIKENPAVRGNDIVKIFTDGASFSAKPEVKNYRPVLMLTHILTYRLFGMNASAFHLGNLLFHCLNVLAVFLLFGYLFSEKWATFFAVLIFAVHPINTEAVTYISSRSSLLATTFFLGAMYLFVKFRKKGRSVYLAASVGFFVISLLTKSIGISLIAVLPLVDYLFLKKKKLKSYSVHFIYLLGGVFYLFLRRFTIGKTFSRAPARDVYTNLISHAKAVLFYFKLYFYPPAQSLIHGLEQTSSVVEPWVLFSAGVILALMVIAWYFHKRDPVLSFGIVFYFICISPTSSFIPLERLVVEHRFYLPGLGITVVTGLILSRIFKKFETSKMRYAVTAGLIGLVLFLGIYTYKRNRIWHSERKLWKDSLKKAPNRALPRIMMGKMAYEEGDYDRAGEHLRTAIRLDPDHPEAYLNLGLTLLRKGDYRKAAGYFREVLKRKPYSVDANEGLARCLARLGRYSEALKYVEEAIERSNKKVPEHFNTRGIVLFRLGRHREAKEAFETVLKLKPGSREARRNLKAIKKVLKK